MATISIHQYNVAESSPVGLRHLEVAPAYVRTILNNSGLLDFGSISNSPSGEKVTVITLRPETNSLLTNMKLWMPTSGGLSGLNANWLLGYVNSGTWVQNYNPTQSQVKIVPNSLPTSPNFFRQDGANSLGSGIYSNDLTPFGDGQVSEFIYLKIFFAPNARPGSYNLGMSGVLQLKCTFDYSDP